MRKKRTALVLAALLAIGTSTPAVISAEEPSTIDGMTVIYENDFDTGSTAGEAFPTVRNDYMELKAFEFNESTGKYEYKGKLTSGGDNPTYKSEGGNGFIHINNTSAWAGRNLVINFMNGLENQSAISSGIIKTEYDLRLRSSSADSVRLGYNLRSTWEGKVYATIEGKSPKTIIPKNNFGDDWTNKDEASQREIPFDEWTHIEVISNFNTKKTAMFVNGGLVKVMNAVTPIETIEITLNGCISGFDNLKITKYDSGYPMTLTEATTASRGAAIKFSDVINDITELENAVLKNVYTGETVDFEVASIDAKSAAITSDDIVVGDEYRLYIPAIKGLQGESSEETEFDFNLASENALKTIRLIGVSGDEVKLNEKNPAEICGLALDFTNDVNVSNALANLTIEDESGNTVAFVSDTEGNRGKVSFDGDVLLGGKTYTIKLGGLCKDYEIGLETDAGKYVVSRLGLTKNDSNVDFDSIDAGDTVKVKMIAANSVGSGKKCFAVITMYNGKVMTGADFATVTIESGKTTSITAEFDVESTEGLSFRGTLWDGDNTFPLTEMTIAE